MLSVTTGWDDDNNVPITVKYDWEYYRTNTSQDANSITSDPLLNSDKSIPSNSPCVDAGTSLSYVLSDFPGTSRPQGEKYDIGAYEFENGDSYSILVRAKGVAGDEQITLKINNTEIKTWTLSDSYQDYLASTALTGEIKVEFINESDGRDVQVDYIEVNGETRQAEDQKINTGVWQNETCGGSNSEWLHCPG